MQDKEEVLTEEERKKMSFKEGELKKCYKCGKQFYLPRTQSESYAYKKKTRGTYGRAKFFCSWSCYRAK